MFAVVCLAFLNVLGCARTVTSLQLGGNDVVFTVNVSDAIESGNRYYFVFSGSSTEITLPNLGDYFVAPGEGDFSEGSLKEFGPDPTTINAYYREYFNTWSDVILLDVTNPSDNAGASTYLVKSGGSAFPATTTQNTSFSATVPNNIEAPYLPSSTQIKCRVPISQFSPGFSTGARIYFKLLTVADNRALSDVTEGILYVENTAAADRSGSESGDARSGAHGSLDITSWSVRVE
jgi:hypothetical protein